MYCISKGEGGAMKVLYGTIGSKPSQSGHQVFLPVIKIVRFDKPRLVIDASGNMLNIVGEAILVFGNIWGKAK